MTPTPSDPIVPVPPATTLTYEQSNTLSNDFNFRGRIKMAILHFADYIMNEPSNIPAHNTRFKWAQNTFASPDQTAASLSPGVVMDAKVQESGSTITDPDLQSSVETTVNKLL